MTTSGPFHIGTLSEFLYPGMLVRFLEKQGGANFIFSADILDAFDSVPASMAAHSNSLSPHLGKPLCDVPDPLGCCASFGEHFLSEALLLVAKFGLSPQIRKASVDYRAGAYDDYARLFIRNLPKVRQVIAETSLNPNLPANWYPIMPQCSSCGRIATTEITQLDEEKYSYSCTRSLEYCKGCGYSGAHKLSEHKYKLQWRLHWPSWMDLNHTHIEGAGMDHHTRGGSWDSCVGVFRGLFNKEPPIGFKFGFVLFGGKKYSKSKGIGMGVTELVRLVPPDVLTYALIRPDLEENRDLNPTGDNLLRLLDDYQQAASFVPLLSQQPEELRAQEEKDPTALALSRANRKKALAYTLAARQPAWQAAFADLLIYHVLYRNWDVVAEKLGHKKDVEFLAPYVENWEKSGIVPPDYSFSFRPSRPQSKAVEEFFSRLAPPLSALDIHNLAFSVAKENNLRAGEFFAELYLCIIGQPKGPKLGKLVEAIGVQNVKSKVLGAP